MVEIRVAPLAGGATPDGLGIWSMPTSDAGLSAFLSRSRMS